MRFLAGIGSEGPDLQDRLDHFKRYARAGVQQSMRFAGGDLSLAELDGGLERAIDEARCALALARDGIDPLAHTGLLSTYSHALIVNSRHEESLEHIQALTRLAETCGLEFPINYAQILRAMALTGMRRFGASARALSTLERRLRDQPNGYFLGNVPIERARLYASVGDLQRAVDVLSPGPLDPLGKTVTGESLGWQAVFQAAQNELGRAQALAASACSTSRALKPSVLASLADAVIALEKGDARTVVSQLQAVNEERDLGSGGHHSTRSPCDGHLHRGGDRRAGLAAAPSIGLVRHIGGEQTRSPNSASCEALSRAQPTRKRDSRANR